MRRENDDVARLDRIDGVARGSEIGVRGWNDAGDDPCRLAVLDDTFFGDLFDDADALLAQRVAQHAADLHALAHAALGVAEAAFGDSHLDQGRERPLVRYRPGHRLAEPVDPCLVIGFYDRQRFAGTLKSSIELLLLFFGDWLLVLGCSHTHFPS